MSVTWLCCGDKAKRVTFFQGKERSDRDRTIAQTVAISVYLDNWTRMKDDWKNEPRRSIRSFHMLGRRLSSFTARANGDFYFFSRGQSNVTRNGSSNRRWRVIRVNGKRDEAISSEEFQNTLNARLTIFGKWLSFPATA